uniref:RNA polymerase II elongation factor ELL N-terminal domain-containing protein n=1 Tax=Neogobius melanostomus TaxID=47308 RepID=A0A8C6WZC6_9GOBI
MASLRQEHHYGLSCGKNSKNNPNRTLYHVKLTDSALRALEAFQNIKGSLQCEPSICFKGSQGVSDSLNQFCPYSKKRRLAQIVRFLTLFLPHIFHPLKATWPSSSSVGSSLESAAKGA